MIGIVVFAFVMFAPRAQDPAASVNLQATLAVKRTTQTCVIEVVAAPEMNSPLAPALHTAFMEELTAKQQKLFTQVVHADQGTTADAHELQLRVLGFGVMDGEGDVAFVSFRVLNRTSGQALTYGRGFRRIGTKQEKDVRDFASLIACL